MTDRTPDRPDAEPDRPDAGPSPDPTDHPATIGPYRILRVLGEGGMGVVYLAEQSEPLRREVALKILKPGMDTAHVVARFESERQALAVMEHPGIARVFDAGSTEAGRPFFVMERVDGVPITRWCDERRLAVRERVALFGQVCRAVQHAHQKGVIHRDLKPSNVMVTADDQGRPQVKVIDFGIARAVAPDEEATRLTALDQSIGTPAYMSPEQARASGLDVDTRTDIYSLGVLLYELVTGALPFDDAAYQGWAFLAHHVAKDAPRPSVRLRQVPDSAAVADARRTTPDALRRELAADLDWIVMKAMEKERDRRYETANGLAMDLDRYLRSEPVVARPPSRAYRTGRFVRRHRAAVVAGAAFVLLLAGFGATMAVQARRIAAARDVADARRGQAEGLIDFMLGDLRAKLEPIGRLEILADVGDQATAYFAALPESEFTDEELLSRSRALSQIGQVRLDEGQTAEAEEALRESLRLARALTDRTPDDPDRLFQLSQSHFWVGYAAWRNDDLTAAEPEFEAYLDVARQLVALDPDNLDYRLELGFAHSNLGSIREARGDLDGAVEAYRQTLAAKEELVRRDSTRIDWLGELAETHNTLGVVYRRQGRFDDALAEHRRELELKRRLLALDPGHAYWRLRLGMAHFFLSALQTATGQTEDAVANGRVALAVLDSLARHDPDNVQWRSQAATVARQLGIALADAGRTAEALETLASALRRIESLSEDDDAPDSWRGIVAGVRATRARVLLRAGDPEAAAREARLADALLAADTTASHRTVQQRAANEMTLAESLRAVGRAGEADVILASALDRLRPGGGSPGSGSPGRGSPGSGPGDGASDPAGGPPADAELDALLARGYLLAGRDDQARPLLDRLWRIGYAEPSLVGLAADHGLAPGSS